MHFSFSNRHLPIPNDQKREQREILRNIQPQSFEIQVTQPVFFNFQMGIFDKEYQLYHVILPMLTKAREEKGLEPLSIPRSFYGHPDPGVLVMNNLKDKGFDLLKNQPEGLARGLQGKEMKLFCQALATFHASTFHLVTTSGTAQWLHSY